MNSDSRSNSSKSSNTLLLASLCFFLASLLDLVCTLHLLSLGAKELNPVAAEFAHDPLSLAMFKLSVVSVVIGIGYLIRRKWVLWFGTILTTLVVVYSSILILTCKFSEKIN